MIDIDKIYFGIVENTPDDGTKNGKVQVRWIGVHTDDKTKLPTEMLPWADVWSNTMNAYISGVGQTNVGMVEGTMVAGIFQDEGFQQPIVLFTLGGDRNVHINENMGFNDPNGVYPKSGVSGDFNSQGGGTANSQAMRARTDNISPKDNKVTPDDPTKPAPTTDVVVDAANAPWLEVARKEIGVTEENNAARVREYHLGGSGSKFSETVAWCSSFVNWCLAQAKYVGTRNPTARSFTNYGADVSSQNPLPPGCIIVFPGTRGPSSGHVVFLVKDHGDGVIECLGGNQSTSEGKHFDTGGAVTITRFKKKNILCARFPTNQNKKA